MERWIILILGILLLAPFILAADIHVPSEFSSIQDAIDNASNGDAIYVENGTYYENQILIDKEIDIVGAGADTTIVDGSGASLASTGLIRITASGDVLFKGFSIMNAGGVLNGGDGNDGKTNVAIYTQSSSSSSTYTISENKIFGTGDANDEEDYGFYSNSGKEHIIFTNNQIRDTGANSILLEKHTGGVSIEENEFDVGVYGIDSIFAMTYGGTNIISQYEINNNYFDLGTGTYDHGAAAVSIASSYRNPPYTTDLGEGRFSNVEIKGNTVDNMKQNRRGITLWNGDFGDGNGGEITASVSDNVFNGESSDGSRGISILGKSVNVNILNNTINNLWRGVWITDSVTGGIHYAINTHVNYNRFEGNNYSLIWDGPSTLDAEDNWWENCNGPSGSDITGIGTTDYSPWLGICIANETIPSCSFEDENTTLGANVTGEGINKVWISALINETWKNYTASQFGQIYKATIPHTDLVGGQNVSWKMYAKDDYGNRYNNDENILYVIKNTFLGVLPFPADGENGWYVSEPIFNLAGDDGGLQSYYQWDSQSPIPYSGSFGLEDIPNAPPIQSAGILDLNWWTEFICGGNLTNESKQTNTFYVDLTNPAITDLVPGENEVVYGGVDAIYSYLDEVWQSNSGVNKSSVIMILDGNAVPATVSSADTMNARVEYSPDGLSQGLHNVSIYVEDKAGRSSYKAWSFELKEPGAFDLKVVAPMDELYDSKRILFNLTTSEEVDKIEYIDYDDQRPRWQRLCRNCDEYVRQKTLNEGNNNITVRATGKMGNIQEYNASFFVDSKPPKISRTLPKKNSETNGNDFYIRYSEDNLNKIVLFWEGVNESGAKELNCTSGKNQDCFESLNLSDFDGKHIDYWFNVSDPINEVSSKRTTVLVDTTSPVLTVNMPEEKNESTPYDRKVPFNISISENSVLEYIDMWDERPQWKRLCANCDDYGMNRAKIKSFRKGIHEITLKATDNAGNTDEKTIGFYVDY